MHVHLVSAIPNGLILEFYRETVDPLRGKIFKEPMRLDTDGCVQVTSGSGSGGRTGLRSATAASCGLISNLLPGGGY